jgi:hypothetical protein
MWSVALNSEPGPFGPGVVTLPLHIILLPGSTPAKGPSSEASVTEPSALPVFPCAGPTVVESSDEHQVVVADLVHCHGSVLTEVEDGPELLETAGIPFD